jgi:hypothetical protein
MQHTAGPDFQTYSVHVDNYFFSCRSSTRGRAATPYERSLQRLALELTDSSEEDGAQRIVDIQRRGDGVDPSLWYASAQATAVRDQVFPRRPRTD